MSYYKFVHNRIILILNYFINVFFHKSLINYIFRVYHIRMIFKNVSIKIITYSDNFFYNYIWGKFIWARFYKLKEY